MTNRFFVPHLQEIHAGAERAGLALSIHFCDWDTAREDRGLQQFCESRVEGVIWAPTSRPKDEVVSAIDKIDASGARCVMLGSDVEGIAVPRVIVHEDDALQLGAEYLFKRGHRHVGIATATKIRGVRAELHRNRLDRMLAAFAGTGITVHPADIFSTSDNEYGGVRLASELAARPVADRPTAIFAADDQLARGLIAGLAISGLSVPGDVSVLGFDDAPGDVDAEVAITSVSLESRAMGRQAVSLLTKLIKNRGREQAENAFAHPEVLPSRIVERDSCGAPRR